MYSSLTMVIQTVASVQTPSYVTLFSFYTIIFSPEILRFHTHFPIPGQETFFSIHLSLGTSTMCFLLVRTTKLLVQK